MKAPQCRSGGRVIAADTIKARLGIERGSIHDYDAMSAFHYRAGRPATLAGVLRAVDQQTGERVGVLVVSMPVLNGAWRNRAFGGWFTTGDKHINAQRINASLRTISRVVIDPRWRSVGIAQRLVRAYRDEPMTRYTEAVAAMGGACPFFEKAGMQRHEIQGRACDGRLVDALGFRGYARWVLADVERATRVFENDLLLMRELRTWARSAGKGVRTSEDVASMVRAAAVRVACCPVGYAHDREDFSTQRSQSRVGEAG